jgi:hypothetical protein
MPNRTRDFEATPKRKRLKVTAHGEARPSPGVDEEAKSLRRRYRRFRTAQNRFDGPTPPALDSPLCFEVYSPYSTFP